ncbi:MAG TPA: hypothetical protein VHA13_00880, partial [Gammaproteobacteria bacterium]|nr:hypothetical protein [Gammaproteobacteria bacterium]
AADSMSMGYLGSALVFGTLLILLTVLYYRTTLSRTFLFWTAFILTRPLGAVLGDFLDKPIASGGLALNRYVATIFLLAFILGCIFIFKQRPAKNAH